MRTFGYSLSQILLRGHIRVGVRRDFLRQFHDEGGALCNINSIENGGVNAHCLGRVPATPPYMVHVLPAVVCTSSPSTGKHAQDQHQKYVPRSQP